MNKNKKVWLSLIAASGLAIAVYKASTPSAETGPRIGSAAPEHQWTDISGQSASLSHYRGRVVLLDFWATWCESCQEELPALQRVYSAYHTRGLEFLAASVDEGGRKAVITYLANHSMPWKVLLSDSKDVEAYRIFGLPTKYLIGRDGTIVQKYVGPVSVEDLEHDIQPLLDTPSTRLPAEGR